VAVGREHPDDLRSRDNEPPRQRPRRPVADGGRADAMARRSQRGGHRCRMAQGGAVASNAAGCGARPSHANVRHVGLLLPHDGRSCGRSAVRGVRRGAPASAAPRRGGHRGAGLCCGVRASGLRSPLRLLVAFGNEGGKPGGLRGPCARGWSQAACVLQHVGAQVANLLGFLPETGRNSRWLANCPGLASENGANPGQFGRSPAQVLRKTRALRQVAHESAHQAPGSSPSLPFATTDMARRAAPAGVDAERPRRRGPRAAPAGADPEAAPAAADPEAAPAGATPSNPERRARRPTPWGADANATPAPRTPSSAGRPARRAVRSRA
jgi:hypothetical protein